MYRVGSLPRTHSIKLAVGGVCLLFLISVVEGPGGWLKSFCLSPLVLTACTLNGWSLALLGVLAFILSEIFSYVRWVPEPVAVLLLLSFLFFFQGQQLRADLRDKEAELQGERNRRQDCRTFFENNPAGILTADHEGRIAMANPAARRLLGFESRPIQGEALEFHLPALANALRIERENQAFPAVRACRGSRPSGEMFLADIWFSVSDTPQGRRLGAVIADASDRLQERERWALRSSMATSEIAIGAILHEFRNLSAAASMTHTNLQRLPGLTENADFAALGSLLKALAKLASAELRPGEGSLGSVDLRVLLEQLRIIIDPWFRESEIPVNWEVAANLPHVWAEEAGLLQIFVNLAQNSNKAKNTSEPMQLTISAGVEGGSAIVRFHDTGPGIAAPDELFKPFQRGGSIKGLGLYVSRAIAHSMCGELKCEPVPVGSCFAVELIPLRE